MKWLNSVLGRIGIGVRRFPVPSAWSICLFLLFSYNTLVDGTAPWLYPLAEAGFGGLAFSLCLTLGSERSGRYPWAPLASLLLAGGLYAVYPSGWPLPYFLMNVAGLVLGFLLLGLFLLWEKGDGAHFFPAVLVAAGKSAGVAILFGISVSICFAAFQELLFSFSFKWYAVVWYAALFLVGTPLFLGWLPSKREPAQLARLLRQLTMRLFLPVYMVLLAILLCYVGKIAAVWELPVGQMNWFASLAVLGYAFFYFTLHGSALPWRRRLFLWGAVLLIPIVAVQLVGIAIRLSAYGLTPARYASLYCVAFGMCVLFVGAAGRSVRFLYPLAAVMVFAAMLSPWNLIDLPARDQQYRMQTVMEQSGMLQDGKIGTPRRPLTKEETDRLVSGYRYFQYSAVRSSDPYAGQIADAEVLSQLDRKARDFGYIEIKMEGPVPIEGWKTLRPFHGVTKNGTFHMTLGESPETETAVDMGNFWQTLYDGHKEGSSMQKANITYDEGGRRFVFKRIHFGQSSQGALPVIHAEGYLLEK